MANESTMQGYWESVPMTVVPMADREVWTVVYEGWWEPLLSAFGNVKIGDSYSAASDNSPSGIYQNAIIVSNLSIRRKEGGLGEVRYEYTALYKREIWNIDMAEVSKDIKVWLVQQYSSWDGYRWVVDDNAWKDLSEIARWENQRDTKSWENWKDFKFDDANGSTKTLGPTAKRLAQKMMKGVTNFPVYMPVITRTTVRAFAPIVGNIGIRFKPHDIAYESNAGWVGFNNESLPTSWENLANVFLKTAERSNSNGDGTFTLVEQWTGADELDPDLYP